MIDPFARSTLGRTTLEVPRFGLGGAPLGDPAGAIGETQAQATIAAAWDGGVRLFDTAPWYGNTKSEHRFGHFLRQRPSEEFVLSTKVGRVYSRPDNVKAFLDSPWVKRWPGGLHFDLRFDYTRDGVARSYEDSLMRLGINRVDALVIHDLDTRHQQSEEGVAAALEQLDAGGGYAVLNELKASGEIKAIGAGVNHTGMIPRFLDRFDIDFFLLAMPYTLLNQEALDLELPLCEARGVSIIIGAVFASGILASGPGANAQYGYKSADAEIIDKVTRMQSVCASHDVSLTAAALQFPLAHPAVAAVLPGAVTPQEVTQNLRDVQAPIPAVLWEQLKHDGLLHEAAPLPVH